MDTQAKVTYQKIMHGIRGTASTIAKMARSAADSSIRWDVISHARNVIRAVPNARDNRAVADTLFFYVKNNYKFVRDPLLAEMVQAPHIAMQTMMGDCDCQVTLLAALNMAVGNEIRFITIASEEPNTMDHVYMQVLDQFGQWIGYDPVVASAVPGWEPPRYYHKIAWSLNGKHEYLAGLFDKIKDEIERGLKKFEKNVIRRPLEEIKRVLKKQVPFLYEPIASVARHVRDEKRRLEKRVNEEFARWETKMGPLGKFLVLGIKVGVALVAGAVVAGIAPFGAVGAAATGQQVAAQAIAIAVAKSDTPFKLTNDEWQMLGQLALTIGSGVITFATAGAASELLAASIMQTINTATSLVEIQKNLKARKEVISELKKHKAQLAVEERVQREAISKLEVDIAILEKITQRQQDQAAYIQQMQAETENQLANENARLEAVYHQETANYRMMKEQELSEFASLKSSQLQVEQQKLDQLRRILGMPLLRA